MADEIREACSVVNKNLLIPVFALVSLIMMTGGAMAAAGISVGVGKSLGCETRYFNVSTSGGYLDARIEVYNSGTTGYEAGARLDIMKNETVIFSAWSDKKVAMPGDRRPLGLHWFSASDDEVDARMTVYCGTESVVTERRHASLKAASTEDIFQVYNIRLYGDRLKFQLRSSRNISEAAIMISNYPPGWMFQEPIAQNLVQGRHAEVSIPYDPGVFYEDQININIIGDNGRYYTSTTYDMKLEEGLSMYWNMLSDWLGNLF